jgi:hypothetical protein
MSKKIFYLSLLVTLIILTVSYFIPVSSTPSGPMYPDKMSAKFYGFPLRFSTSSYGGVAGYTGKRQFDSRNLSINFLAIFIITLGAIKLVQKGK